MKSLNVEIHDALQIFMMLIRADCGEQKVDRFVHRQLCIHMMHLNHMLLKKNELLPASPRLEGRKEGKKSKRQPNNKDEREKN